MVATNTRESAIKMNCTQSIELSESDKVNQIDEVGRVAVQEGEGEEIEAKVSTANEEKGEVKVKEKERAAVPNEDSCLESKEEEIVVQSFASLAEIKDVNEDKLETATKIESEIKSECENPSEGSKLEIGEDKNFKDSTKKGNDDDDENDQFTKSQANMIEENNNKSGQSDDYQAQSEESAKEDSNSSADKEEEFNADKEIKEVEKVLEQVVANGSEQNAEQTPAEEEQEKTSKVCEKSEENVYDDYKEALANVANEQRRLNEQLSILSASLPPSPETPISSASSASSADLPTNVCVVGSISGTNVSSYGGEEVEDDNEDTSSYGEEEEEDDGDYCPEPASVSTLRRLKMNTFKDIMVCEKNHESMEAARRLFDELARNGPKNKLAQSRNSSLDSSSSDYKNMDLSPTGSKDSSEQREGDSAGYEMKILRRSGSSISNSNSFRQTLVCSVSPIDKRSDNGSLSEVGYYESPHPLYPINGEEIKHCQTAFRENKRLIEEQQVAAAKLLNEERTTTTSCANSIINGNNNSSINNSCYGSGRWIRFNREFLEQASQSKCSRCNHRVYPTDKIELDFTRTKLNIHRNCFKCQICSTLLR